MLLFLGTLEVQLGVILPSFFTRLPPRRWVRQVKKAKVRKSLCVTGNILRSQ